MQKKGRLQEDDFSFKMVSMEEFMKVVLKLNSKIYIYIYMLHVWKYSYKYPETNYRDSFEISDKHHQSLFKRIHFS